MQSNGQREKWGAIEACPYVWQVLNWRCFLRHLLCGSWTLGSEYKFKFISQSRRRTSSLQCVRKNIQININSRNSRTGWNMAELLLCVFSRSIGLFEVKSDEWHTQTITPIKHSFYFSQLQYYTATPPSFLCREQNEITNMHSNYEHIQTSIVDAKQQHITDSKNELLAYLNWLVNTDCIYNTSTAFVSKGEHK